MLTNFIEYLCRLRRACTGCWWWRACTCLALSSTGCASPSAFCPANVIYGKPLRYNNGANPDLTLHLRPIQIRILPQALHMLGNLSRQRIIFNILGSTGILNFSGKKYGIVEHFIWLKWIPTDLDPLKWCRSDRIRIHSTTLFSGRVDFLTVFSSGV